MSLLNWIIMLKQGSVPHRPVQVLYQFALVRERRKTFGRSGAGTGPNEMGASEDYVLLFSI
jgi:hypothetical protein